MFFAISKKTGNKVNSLTIEEDSSYEFLKEEKFFADPDEIENCPNEIDINKIEVRFREGSTENISSKGKKYKISAHFYIPNKQKLGIDTVPESKEHKLSKNWIYNRIKDKNLIINYSKINKPYRYKNSINVFDLPIDYEKIGIEVTTSKIGNLNSRRADIIIPFIVKHPILGNGVVIEIQFTKQKNKTKLSREYDWGVRGYSIGWLFLSDFNEISDKIIELKKESIDISSFASLIKQNNKQFIKNLKSTVQEESIKLENKKYDIKEEIDDLINKSKENSEEIKQEIRNEKMKKITISREEINDVIKEEIEEIKKNIQPTCPQCHIPMLLKKNRNGTSKFWGCSNYPECRCTSAIKE